MIKSKYVPLKYDGLYYIYDALNRWIYPCTQTIYMLFKKLSYKQLLQLSKMDGCCTELVAFLKLLSDNKNKYTLFSYPTFSRENVVQSLVKVPNIVLELTQKCNLSCVYCCYGNLYKSTISSEKKDNNENNVVGYLKTLLSYRRDSRIMSEFRISFYGGEPLLCMNVIKKCVNLAHQMFPRVKVSYGITTNGVLLNKFMEYLVENDFHILISLDGNKKNNQYRIYKSGKESFDDIVRNVQALYLRYPLFFKNNVDFSTVLHGKSNYIEAIDFFSKWNKIPLLSQVTKENVKSNLGKMQEVFCMHDYSKDEIASFIGQHPHEYSILFPAVKGQCCLWQRKRQVSVQALNEVIYDNYQVFPVGGCTLFASKLFVTESGKIYLCEKSSRKFAFGKVHAGKLTIYLKRINAYYANMRRHFQVACLECYKSTKCQCCFFAECENISSAKCFCSKEQAIAELQEMLTE